MSTNYRIRKPYVLATLPQPFNPETGRFFVGDVFGHQMDAARKRRTEVIAAIDGESVSLYDIASSSLITSHPIPPEQSFSCPPVSLRLRLAKPHGTVRYTFAATHTSTSTSASSSAKAKAKLKQRLTVFRDSVDANGKATSESQSVAVPSPSPVMLLDASTVMSSPTTPGNARFEGNLIAVCRNGDVLCFNPEDLRLLWHQSGSSLAQDEVSKFSDLAVEHAAVVPVGDVIDGLFEGNADAVSSAFSRAVTATQKKRADVVVFVARVTRDSATERLLGVLAVNPTTAAAADSTAPALVRLHVARLPDPEKLPAAADRQYRLHVASGSLAVVGADHLYVFDISRAIPRIAATMHRESACSMLRLSNHSLMAVSPAEVAVCNPGFGSVQALMSLDLAALNNKTTTTSSNKKKTTSSSKTPLRFDMLANFKKLDLVVGLVADQLVALPVEQPRLGAKKRQAEGLLIDSIGRGGPRDPLRKRRRSAAATANKTDDDDDFFAAPLPGTLTAEYVAKMRADMAEADAALAAGDAARFDALLATHFSMTVAPDSADGEWEWKPSVKEYPLVDRRWVLYALTRVFALDEPAAGDVDGDDENSSSNNNSNNNNDDDERLPELRVAHASTNLAVYLAVAGHFTLRNIRAAFREQLENADVPDSHLARDAVQRLVDVDPSMDLLRSYIAASKLTAVELLTAILMIMRSMGYVADGNNGADKAVADSGSSTTAVSPADDKATDESDPDVDLQLDILEAELNATELYLDADSTRAVALAQAFGKLAAQSSAATVASLRATLQPHQVLALIRVLRNELVRGAWTTRYIDAVADNEGEGDEGDEQPTVDGAITMVSDLLARCIDAVGMLGWMVHDGHSLGGNSGSNEAELGDFLSALKLEVSAALQGLEECVVLEGLVGGVVRHGQSVQRARAATEKRDAERGVRSKPETVVVGSGSEAAMLPLGGGSGWVQAETETGWKIDKAGEIVQRSQRELEHLLSKGTRIYSLEKLKF